jgi:hypothetical protein
MCSVTGHGIFRLSAPAFYGKIRRLRGVFSACPGEVATGSPIKDMRK